MAKIDFPVATADGQIFVADTNVIYTYIGNPPAGYWSGFAGADSANLGDTFVKVAGDNMTGNLTLDTDKITLNKSGTGSFVGKITAASTEESDSGTTVVTKDYLATTIDNISDVVISETAPADPSEGDLWWNSNTDSGKLYIYYVDADSSQWVETSPNSGVDSSGQVTFKLLLMKVM